jgi:hypothetical protein
MHFNASVREIDAYILTGSKDPQTSLTNSTGLFGTGVEMNGRLLQLATNDSVPKIESFGVRVEFNESGVSLQPTSISFFVVDSNVAACE